MSSAFFENLGEVKRLPPGRDLYGRFFFASLAGIETAKKYLKHKTFKCILSFENIQLLVVEKIISF